jgi:hypothetical protein
VLWFPETLAAKRQAVRYGVSDPDVAIELAAEHLAAKRSAVPEGDRNAALPPSGDDDADRNEDGYVLAGVPTAEALAVMTDEEIREAARATAQAAVLDGHPVTGEEIGGAYSRSDSWGRARIREVKVIRLGAPDSSASGG